MDEWMRVQQQKVEARMKLQKRLASGELRLEQVSIAAAFPESCKNSPLGVDHVELSEYEFPDVDYF